MALPTLNASSFHEGSPLEQRQFARKLLQSCASLGFVKIINHGISDETISELFSWTRKFFDLNASTKASIAHPAGPEPQRGWSCMGAEKTARLFSNGIGAEGKIDAREHFDQGAPTDSKFPNRWPEEMLLPGFRQFMERFYDECQNVSSMILQAFEISFGLQFGTLAEMCREEASELRLNHYPAIDITEMHRGRTSRIHPHTDLGVITCLFQDKIGGLEMEDRNQAGRFIPVTSSSTSVMIVNISETFQRWTNGRLKAGVHHVTIPLQMKSLGKGIVSERYSVAFFVKADRSAFAGALEQFVSDEEPALYETITALEYHQRRLATAY